MALLDEIMAENTAGDPMSAKKWSRKDTRSVSHEMRGWGLSVCPNTIGKLLKKQDYSLRLNRKSIAETHSPHRDQQFRIIAQFRKHFEDAGWPILSLDSKKKELIGNFRNPGRAWGKQPEAVFEHDFRSCAHAVATPYGIFDTVRNHGAIVIGTSSDTPEFAVDCLDTWLEHIGWSAYPQMKQILLLCDSGGSNGCRPRLWKFGLYHTIARRHGLTVMVCHYPSGASKWNPVEHRLFSFITSEWAGHPLRSVELMCSYIEATKTKTGLHVSALVNPGNYTTGKKVSDRVFREIPLQPHDQLPAWNYTITPN